jgi:hypothetical protein
VLIVLLACRMAATGLAQTAGEMGAATKTKSAEAIRREEEHWDATAWKDEVLAVAYERTLVKLRDDSRNATNKIQALASLDFDEILVPKPKPGSTLLPLEIHAQEFDNTNIASLSRQQWNEILRRLDGSGWRLDQVEWTHEKFAAAREGSAAWSEFRFELHGERLPLRSRFILKGTARVTWESPPGENKLARAKRLVISDVSVIERLGPPGFSAEAVVTPEPPAKTGVMVDMHPLIVTDIDGDGAEDVILCGVNKLFRNDGKGKFAPGEFIAESVFQGSREAGLIADFNGDGKLDFLTVAKKGALTNTLALYPGDGTTPFHQKPMAAWEGAKILAPSVITAADIDGDGDLDVWIGQYKPPYAGGQLPTPYYDANDGYPSYLLLNDGRGHFEQATTTRGLAAKRFRRTFAASFVDLNGDNSPDLVTANDYDGVDLYYNDGKGNFLDRTELLYNRHLFGMGHCFADFDGDGALDIYTIGMSVAAVRRLDFMGLKRSDFPDRTAKRTDMGYGNRIYTFKDGKWQKPWFADDLADTGWSWGTTAFDFNNDTRMDIYVANGHLSGESSENFSSHIWRHDIYVGTSREDSQVMLYFDPPFRGINTGKTSSDGYEHNVLFMDMGANRYRNVAFLMGVAHETDSRAVVSADLNNDGRMDLLLTDGQWYGGPQTGRNRLHVHLNQVETKNHWIGMKLAANVPGISPIGAKVWARSGNQTWQRQIVTGDSYQSQHPNTVHFGLGTNTQVNELIVRWSNGKTNRLENPEIDRYHLVSPAAGK